MEPTHHGNRVASACAAATFHTRQATPQDCGLVHSLRSLTLLLAGRLSPGWRCAPSKLVIETLTGDGLTWWLAARLTEREALAALRPALEWFGLVVSTASGDRFAWPSPRSLAAPRLSAGLENVRVICARAPHLSSALSARADAVVMVTGCCSTRQLLVTRVCLLLRRRCVLINQRSASNVEELTKHGSFRATRGRAHHVVAASCANRIRRNLLARSTFSTHVWCIRASVQLPPQRWLRETGPVAAAAASGSGANQPPTRRWRSFKSWGVWKPP